MLKVRPVKTESLILTQMQFDKQPTSNCTVDHKSLQITSRLSIFFDHGQKTVSGSKSQQFLNLRIARLVSNSDSKHKNIYHGNPVISAILGKTCSKATTSSGARLKISPAAFGCVIFKRIPFTMSRTSARLGCLLTF